MTLHLLSIPSQLIKNRAFTGAAAMAFYLTLAAIPAVVTLMSLLPYLAFDDLMLTISNQFIGRMPGSAGKVLIQAINDFSKTERPGLFSVSFFGTIWATSSGITSIIEQINISYRTYASRSFLKERGLAFFMTLFLILTFIIAAYFLFLTNRYKLYFLDFSLITSLILATQYSFLFALLFFTFATFYYFAPIEKYNFNTVLPGSLLSSCSIMLLTFPFDLYISTFSNFDSTYKNLAGVLIFMLWLYIIGFVLILGAEYNSLLLHSSQKRKSSI